MAKVIITVSDKGAAEDNKHLVGFSVKGVKSNNDPEWLSGVALAVKEAINNLLENTMGINKKVWKKKK